MRLPWASCVLLYYKSIKENWVCWNFYFRMIKIGLYAYTSCLQTRGSRVNILVKVLPNNNVLQHVTLYDYNILKDLSWSSFQEDYINFLLILDTYCHHLKLRHISKIGVFYSYTYTHIYSHFSQYASNLVNMFPKTK